METGNKTVTRKIALGITDDEVPLGSHLLHFWRNDEEFESGVRFLHLGIADSAQFCVLFGNDEANQRVLEVLRKRSDDLDHAIADGRLVVLRRDASASVTLARIEDAFSTALRKGATAIRYLGTLGIGRDPLPGRGADEVIELEHEATALTARYPCVVVCMYDLNTVSGHLLLNAGFASHPLTVWRNELRNNVYDSSAEGAGTDTSDGGIKQ
jgi:MEDS: MEthanogen/methylotroph, DcmR Sensory domain